MEVIYKIQIYKRELLDLLTPKSTAKLVIKTNFRNDAIFLGNKYR